MKETGVEGRKVTLRGGGECQSEAQGYTWWLKCSILRFLIYKHYDLCDTFVISFCGVCFKLLRGYPSDIGFGCFDSGLRVCMFKPGCQLCLRCKTWRNACYLSGVGVCLPGVLNLKSLIINMWSSKQYKDPYYGGWYDLDAKYSILFSNKNLVKPKMAKVTLFTLFKAILHIPKHTLKYTTHRYVSFHGTNLKMNPDNNGARLQSCQVWFRTDAGYHSTPYTQSKFSL